jgi:hypothetical protein
MYWLRNFSCSLTKVLGSPLPHIILQAINYYARRKKNFIISKDPAQLGI